MNKLVISLFLITTLSGCAHQLFETEPEAEVIPATESNINQPIAPKPAKSGIPQTPYKRINKTPSGDAYND